MFSKQKQYWKNVSNLKLNISRSLQLSTFLFILLKFFSTYKTGIPRASSKLFILYITPSLFRVKLLMQNHTLITFSCICYHTIRCRIAATFREPTQEMTSASTVQRMHYDTALPHICDSLGYRCDSLGTRVEMCHTLPCTCLSQL